MSTKRRIEKLEQATGGSSRLYFLGVHVPENQSNSSSDRACTSTWTAADMPMPTTCSATANSGLP